MNGFLFFFLLVILPLAGFPVTILYLLVGLRYDFASGLAFTALSIFCNLLVTKWITVSLMRKPLEKYFLRIFKRNNLK